MRFSIAASFSFASQNATCYAHFSFQTPEPETPSPEPREEEADMAQQIAREEKLEKGLASSNQLTVDNKKHSNNNMLACK